MPKLLLKPIRFRCKDKLLNKEKRGFVFYWYVLPIPISFYFLPLKISNNQGTPKGNKPVKKSGQNFSWINLNRILIHLETKRLTIKFPFTGYLFIHQTIYLSIELSIYLFLKAKLFIIRVGPSVRPSVRTYVRPR